MNLFARTSLLFLATLSCIVIPRAGAQILYVSNLSESSPNAIAVGSNRWIAQPFETGDAEQYALDTVTLDIGNIIGSPQGFTVRIFSDNAGTPSVSVGALSGSLSIGEIPFDASGITLDGSSTYWIVLSTDSLLSSGSFPFWKFTNSSSFAAQDEWSIPLAQARESADAGTNWTPSFSVAGGYQFSIDAVAIPEPAPLALGGVAAAAFAFRWRRRK